MSVWDWWFARRYHRRTRKAIREWKRSPRCAEIRACPHADRRPNPDAEPRPGVTFQICNGCGIGISSGWSPR